MALFTSKSRVKSKFVVDKKVQEAKKSRQDELDELCVVGYACKLFRDDARALAIDRGGHLIPWMNDKSLMIDRYDGRGHLHDLSDFDRVGWNEDVHLSAEAARIEALCDEERYLALHTDLLEEQTRHEEELKRLNEAITSDSGYGAVGFNYGAGKEDYDPMQPTEDEQESMQRVPASNEYQPPLFRDDDTPSEVEEPFIAPADLKLPPGMEQPQTLKIHTIIEKTAMFVCNQGAQMEIIVKTKQANNPQFDFLHFDHYLNPYYKHLVKAVKAKTYIPMAQREDIHTRRQSSNSNQSDDEDDENEGSGYLHPSLFAPPRPKPTSAQIQTHPPPSTHHPGHLPPGLPSHQGEVFTMVTSQQPTTYYEGAPTTTAPVALNYLPPMLAPPPPPPDDGNSVGSPVQLSHPMVPGGFMPVDSLPPGSGLGPPPPHHPHHPHHHPHHPPLVPLIHDSQQQPPITITTLASVLGQPIISQAMPIPPAADESAINPQAPPIVPPPPDVQPIIDKLAKYVAKNGDEFEASVRAKSDPRFDFLQPWHSYNAYYLAKKTMFLQELNQGAEGDDMNATDKTKKVPVSFSIKGKGSEERTLGRKSALPVESSSDSDEETEQTTSNKQTKQPAWDIARDAQRTVVPQSEIAPPMATADEQGNPLMRLNEGRPLDYGGEWTQREKVPPQLAGEHIPMEYGDSELYQLEYDKSNGRQHWSAGVQFMDVLPEGSQQGEFEQGDVDWDGKDYSKTVDGQNTFVFHLHIGNQHRLEDRLALAARKKLASASQERNVQVERRKKAALFLNMIRDRPQAAAAAQEDLGPDQQKEMMDTHDPDRNRSANVHPRKPRSPPRSYRGQPSPPSRGDSQHSGGRVRTRSPPVPKSYQTAFNRGAVEREKRRKRHSRSRSPSPRRAKRPSPAPHPASSAGTPAVIGRSSSVSPPMMRPEVVDLGSDREVSVSSPSSDSSSRLGSESSIQPTGTETKVESKTGGNDLRAKIRAMLAATMGPEQQ